MLLSPRAPDDGGRCPVEKGMRGDAVAAQTGMSSAGTATGGATVERPATGEPSIADQSAGQRGGGRRPRGGRPGEVLERDETTGRWVYRPSPGMAFDWNADTQEWRDRESWEVVDMPPPEELREQIFRRNQETRS